MKFEELVQKTGHLSCFTAGFLAAGQNLHQINLQLARWIKSGRIIRIHKGLYTLAELYRKNRIDLYYISNKLKPPSYTSMQSALAWCGLIPEYVPAVVSVTTARPQTIYTPVGRFEYRHIKKTFFWGYQKIETSPGTFGLMAFPEKALLDLLYLTAGSDSEKYLKELRLQNTDRLNEKVLEEFAAKTKSPKLMRAVKLIIKQIRQGEGSQL